MDAVVRVKAKSGKGEKGLFSLTDENGPEVLILNLSMGHTVPRKIG